MDGVPDAPWVSRSVSPLGPPTWSYRAVRRTARHHSHAMGSKRKEYAARTSGRPPGLTRTEKPWQRVLSKATLSLKRPAYVTARGRR